MSSQAPGGAVPRPFFPPPVDQMKDMYIGNPGQPPPGPPRPPVSSWSVPPQGVPPPFRPPPSWNPGTEQFSQAPPMGAPVPRPPFVAPPFAGGPPSGPQVPPQGPPSTGVAPMAMTQQPGPFMRPPPGNAPPTWPPTATQNMPQPALPGPPPYGAGTPSFSSQAQGQQNFPPGPPLYNAPPQAPPGPPLYNAPSGPPSFGRVPSPNAAPTWTPPPQGPPGPPLYGRVPATPPQWSSQPAPRPNYPPSQGPPPPFGRPPAGSWQPPVSENYQQPGSPLSSSASNVSRVDPSQIPRPQQDHGLSTYETVSNNLVPPSVTSNFVVRDLGNCSPRIMRSTLYQVPCSGELLNNAKLPLALFIQPLALPHVDEEPIKLVDCGESGPVRCSRCKGYINPFAQFVDQGRRFVCNFCGHSNDTPRDYFCNLGPDGRRRDADERPELSRGTVEFVATREFMVRPPMPQVFFFLVDVSANAIKTGAVAAACSSIQKALTDIREGPRTLAGVATFDSTIHFYNINKELQQPSMLIVPDIQDVYVPIGKGLLVPISEGLEHIEMLLESIPSMFQDTQVQESALGAAIKASFLALKPTGGKILVFQSVLPSIGVGALTPREAEWRNPNEKEAHKVFQPADKVLKNMAEELSLAQVCVDLFFTTQSYVDIASLGVVPGTTGGQIYYYFPFSATMDSAKLYNDLRWNLTRPQGLEAVMRVRCSQGLRVEDYYGNCKRVSTDVDLPAIDCDKCIMVTFKHDDKFQEGADCCFQSALLYTTTDGQRRIRVSTLSLTCTSSMSTLFKNVDLDAQFTYLLKQAAQNVHTTPLNKVREEAINQCVQSLLAYRKYCASASYAGQLILPESLKLCPLYTLALTKSIGLRQDARVDERSYWLARATIVPPALAIPLVYPRMFPVHKLPKDVALPPTLSLSSENLDPEGIFLLETGEDAFLYAGRAVSSELLYQLFEVHSVDEVVPGQFSLQEYTNEPSILLNKMVNEIRRQRSSYLRLHLLKRGDPSEILFHSFMVEDKTALGASYVEFLVHLHRQIQSKLNVS